MMAKFSEVMDEHVPVTDVIDDVTTGIRTELKNIRTSGRI